MYNMALSSHYAAVSLLTIHSQIPCVFPDLFLPNHRFPVLMSGIVGLFYTNKELADTLDFLR